METFLNKLSKELLKQFGKDMLNVTVVLPNRRSKVFLIDALKQNSQTTIFSPNICSIQELIELISGLRTIDPVESLFEFYKVYSDVSDELERQDFERFAPWAKVLIKDFNEIDSYLVEPEKILKYLEEIKEIEHWSLSDSKSEMIEKHLKFWSLLPKYYQTFNKYLQSKNTAYQGLQFKNAESKKVEFLKNNPNQFYVFAGFNALMPSEESIIKHFLKENRAKIYWDIDQTLLNNSYNQAGYFIRKFKNNWSYYKSNSFDWIFDEFSQQKNIQIIGTPKSVGQAKVVGKIIEDKLDEDLNSLNKIALVLSEKSLLLPMLYSLPKSVEALNITLEYSAKNNPIQFLVNKLFRLHLFSSSKDKVSSTFYYKDVLEILSNPYVEPYLNSNDLVNLIKSSNYTFIAQQKLIELYEHKNEFFNLIFDVWPKEIDAILDRISSVLLFIKSNLDVNSDSVALTFVFEIHKVINKLKNYFLNSDKEFSVKTLYAIYRQVIDVAEVSFEGEPLLGLQVMGILESRTLDFENVIITSVNEGKIPFGKSQNSFIPYDVKVEFGLPTYRDRDAIYTYHFYRLLQRAKNIYLVYNTEDDGLDGGEKSRFITQLKIEKQPNHILTEKYFNAYLPTKSFDDVVIEKSPQVIERLKEISDKGFSPSSLSLFVRNPLDFYFQRVLRINENKEVEETIEANTLGNVIHKTLEELFKAKLNKYLSVEDVTLMQKQYESYLIKYFKEEFKQGDISRGKNLLAFESAKRSIYNYLQLEKESIESSDTVKVLYLEHEFSMQIIDSRLPYPVVLKGNIDRIEERNGKIRIIDYKTGKVEPSNLRLNDWNQLLTVESKGKIIQLLCYVLLFKDFAKSMEIESGIISFKNLKNGFMPFGFEIATRKYETIINDEYLTEFRNRLVDLLLEILNKDISFRAKK